MKLRKIVWSSLLRNSISYGIMAYCVPTNKWLLVQRRFSPEFIILLRGSYRLVDVPNIIAGLSPQESKILSDLLFDSQEQPFTTWYNRVIRDYDVFEDYQYSWKRFSLCRTVLINLITHTPLEILTEKEWMWPKGRPQFREDHLVCALREFYEETGVEIESLGRGKVTNTRLQYHELSRGTNGRIYETSFWLYLFHEEIPLTECEFDSQGEIGERRWVPFSEALRLLKPSKRNLLLDAQKMVDDRFL